jgi:hypothetical protein
MRYVKLASLAIAALALTLPALSPVQAGNKNAAAKYGKPTGGAKVNVNKPKASANHQRPSGGQGSKANASKRPNSSKPKGNNVVAGNTVVVGRPPAGNGYYDNGNYNNRPDWDDDDNDFLEFVGKTAAITAGVSVVTAVIGSVANEKPEGCQPVVSGGVQYQLCDGVYYQQIQQGGQPAYQVVSPPAQ